MKTRFNLVLIVSLICAGLYAGTYQESFSANQEAILSGDCLSVGDIYFGVGTSVSRGQSYAQQEAAISKARLAALVNLIGRKATASIQWPEELDSRFYPVLVDYVARDVTMKARVNGAETVFVGPCENEGKIAVVAADKYGLRNVPSLGLGDAKRVLLNPKWLKRHFKEAREALYSFYLTEKPLPPELEGKDMSEWTEEDEYIFCGLEIPAKVKEAMENNEETEREVEEKFPSYILPPYATDNENDTIGF